MSDEFLPYGQQAVDGDDARAVLEVLEGDWLTTGPTVDAFEARLARCCGSERAVAVSSGTAALHAAYRAAGVGPNTEVVVPALTFSATANAAVHLGATVRFADVDERTLTVDPESVDRLVGDDTAAVVPVDFAGHPADLDAIAEVADRVGAVVVEDGAHSLGAAYRGRPVGAVADMTTFSFHPVKVATTGEGGAVVTDDENFAASMRRFRNHGMDPEAAPPGDETAGGWAYDIDKIGHNYRITDLQCALGISQLEKLDEFVGRRRQIAEMYRRRLADVDELQLPPEADWCGHAYHLFIVRVDADRRREIFERLRDRSIGVQVHYIPVNMLTAYRRRGHDPTETPVALSNYRRMISVPCFPKMTDRDVDRVATALREITRGQR